LDLVHILDCSPNDLLGYRYGDRGLDKINSTRLNDQIEEAVCPEVLRVEIGENLVPLFTDDRHGGMVAFKNFRGRMANKYGLVLPLIRLRDIQSLGPDYYRLSIRGRSRGERKLVVDGFWREDLDLLQDQPIEWIDQENPGYKRPVDLIMDHFEALIIQHIDQVISLQYVADVLQILNKDQPALVQNLREALALIDIKRLFIQIIRQGGHLRDVGAILESALEKHYT